MLAIPKKMFDRSTRAREKVRLDVLCDWIEGSVLFDEGELSPIDITDVLLEEEIYIDQQAAYNLARSAWTELQKRRNWIGEECAFTLDGDWIRRKAEWKISPAQTFCVLLSLTAYYDWWVKEFGGNYTEQGELFELLTKESLQTQFDRWIIYPTGWSAGHPKQLAEVVNDVVTRLGESLGDFELWNQPYAKEHGLDLLCYRPFPDERVRIPVYLLQCASGGNWKSKLHTPNLKIWQDMINFKSQPQRAFALPFALPDDEFKRCAGVGLLLDRYRLLGAARYRRSWVPQPLRERIIAWSEPRIEVLLRRSM